VEAGVYALRGVNISIPTGSSRLPDSLESSMTGESKMRLRNSCCTVLLLVALLSPLTYGDDKKPSREEARFDIYVAGKKISQEKFSLESSPDSNLSNSTLNFSDPNTHQNMQIETKLKMDGKYMPLSYQAKTTTAGHTNAMSCKFTPGQVAVSYRVDGMPGKSGLLVGDRYAILDTNVFHHFIFVARLFDFSSTAKSQSVEVVIPQQMETGILKISEIGIEKVSIGGKNKELHHLKADSGPLLIDLWIDDKHVLYKIALRARHIEALRNP
jgi:hypothetical protein